MSARIFVWLTISGGAWQTGANWDDTTDGQDPSLVAPGAADSVTVMGQTGASLTQLNGPGMAAAALLMGNTLLSGQFGIASLVVGQAAGGGILELGAGTALQTGTLSVISGSLIVGNTSSLSDTGLLSLSAAPTPTTEPVGASFNATGGGLADVAGLYLNAPGDSIYVDPTSIIEVTGVGGAGGQGKAGQLTIDAGAALTGQGNADAYGQLVNNGTITAAGGTLTLGAISGTGTLQIDAGAALALNGAVFNAQSVQFAGANATLVINEEFYAPPGIVSGLAPGDAIDFAGSPISLASYSGNIIGGTLNLYYGTQLAASLHLSGDYTGDVFLTAGDGAGGTLVTLAPKAAGGSTASPGTSAPDAYSWNGAASGAWNSAANWTDTSSGASPAKVAPGKSNLVSIAASAGTFTVIAGPANAASLGLTGEVALSGAFSVGTLTVGQASGITYTNASLDLLSGTSLAAKTASIAAGGVTVSGTRSGLSVQGTLTLGGGISGVGLPVTAVSASAGGVVQVGALVMGGGSGDNITTDPNSTIEIGRKGGAVAGAITIDPSASLTGNGTVNPLGLITNNGVITASGGVLTLGAVSGTGSLVIGNNSELTLWAPTSEPINFASATGTADAVLAFANGRDAPTGTISGIVPGDLIDLQGSTLANIQTSNYTSSFGTLNLLYNGVTVARLVVAGNFTNARFTLLPDGAGGTFIALLPSQSGKQAGTQSGTDSLVWNSTNSGAWNNPANWLDTITGKTATAAPGSQTPVQVTGPGGASFASLGGPGVCASLGVAGNVGLTGTITTGALSVGQSASGTNAAVAGVLEIGVSTSLTASTADLVTGEIIASGLGARLLVTGALSLDAVGSLLEATTLATVEVGDVTSNGASFVVTPNASMEVGTLGGAALSALTIDAGFGISGTGSLNIGAAVIDNGSITALGGTLVVGNVTGAGVLDIGTEGALALSSATPVPIAFTGGGGALVLPANPGTLSTPITGFTTGDSIVTGAVLSGVQYAPGAGGLGTLTLLSGGQAVGSLVLAGSYAGEAFQVSADGAGSAISVAPVIYTGPPSGTTAPDIYSWVGGSSGAWNNASNWNDSSAGQSPAAVPPGQFDFLTIGAVGQSIVIVGPGNAAGLSTAGTVALGGDFNIGTLSVGQAGTASVLGLSAGSTLNLANASLLGGLSANGATVAVAGTLSLGEAAQGTAGLVSLTQGASLQAGAVVLAGGPSVLATDGSSNLEIGGSLGTAPGAIVVDASGTLVGAGSVQPAGMLVNNGAITASGGTLYLTSVAGTGGLLVGPDATLDLLGSVSTGQSLDFAGAGTAIFAQINASGGIGPAISDFGPSDQLILPLADVTESQFAVTAPDVGVLTLLDSSGDTLASLTFLGSQNGLVFTTAAAPGGGVLISETTDNMSGSEGDGFVTNPASDTGTYVASTQILEANLAPALNANGKAQLSALLSANPPTYEYYSGDGLTPKSALGTSKNTVGVEVIGALNSVVGSGAGPLAALALLPGYSAMILEGHEALGITDSGRGHALLVGNTGNDTIYAGGTDDTLVGGTGGNTTFSAASTTTGQTNVSIIGGGNDLIYTANDNAAVTTSGGKSTVDLGSANNVVKSYGGDTIACNGSGIASDTIYALAAGPVGDVVYGPNAGQLVFNGGAAPDTVVGRGSVPGGSQLVVYGGSAAGSQIFAGDAYLQYYGGAGSATIIEGSASSLIHGGTGPITVWGGTGSSTLSGAAYSEYVLGTGAATVTSAAGDTIIINGASAVSVMAGSGSNSGVTVNATASTANNVFNAGAGNETLYGGNGNDKFFAGSGNGLFVAGHGNDVFNFTMGKTGATGSDTIAGFNTSHDVIALHGYGSQSPAVSISGGNSIFTLADGTHVTVLNVTNLSAANFSVT